MKEKRKNEKGSKRRGRRGGGRTRNRKNKSKKKRKKRTHKTFCRKKSHKGTLSVESTFVGIVFAKQK